VARYRPDELAVSTNHHALENSDGELLLRRTSPIENRRGSESYRGGNQKPESATPTRLRP
jgi:hypothetical protein